MQTSIEWLLKELNINLEGHDDIIQEAKEIHKQEIKDAKDGLYQDTSHRGYPRTDEVDKFEQDAWDNYEHVEWNLYSTTFRNAFKLGYNKAKETLYTKEEVIKFAEWCRTQYKVNGDVFLIEQLFSEYKSLK